MVVFPVIVNLHILDGNPLCSYCQGSCFPLLQKGENGDNDDNDWKKNGTLMVFSYLQKNLFDNFFVFQHTILVLYHYIIYGP